MKRFLLHSGARIPVLGLGTWKADSGIVGQAVVSAVRDLGYRHLDCAAIYGNEPEIGAALKEIFETDGTFVNRNDLFVTSKLWNAEHAPADVETACRKTLADLGLEYLDLYLIHWPVALSKTDSADNLFGKRLIPLEELPIIDTWRAMEALVDKGLVRDIGVSNFSKKKLQALMEKARIPPSVNQVEMHPYLQMKELVEYCEKTGIHLTAYSPLGSKDRPDSIKSTNEVPILQDATVARVASSISKVEGVVSPAQVLLAWGMERGTSVIPKSVSPQRQAENLASAALSLDKKAMEELDGLDRHARYVDGSFWCDSSGAYTLETLWDEPAVAKTGAEEL